MKKIKVIIAEDKKMFRDMLAKGLIAAGIDVIGVAENGKVLLDMIKVQVPEVIIMDLNMPEMNGIEALKVLSKKFPNIKTIILSDHCTDYYTGCVILLGAAAYLNKNTDFDEVAKAIEYVQDNGVYFNEIISEEIVRQLNEEKRLSYIIENEKFSAREIQILVEVCKNKLAKEISADLGISESTVKYHKGQLLQKTGSLTSTDLIFFAIRQGIFNPDEMKSSKKGRF